MKYEHHIVSLMGVFLHPDRYYNINLLQISLLVHLERVFIFGERGEQCKSINKNKGRSALCRKT